MDGRPADHDPAEISQKVLPTFQLLVTAWAEAAAKRRLTTMIDLIRMVPINPRYNGADGLGTAHATHGPRAAG
jgi:hypothetical protein